MWRDPRSRLLEGMRLRIRRWYRLMAGMPNRLRQDEESSSRWRQRC